MDPSCRDQLFVVDRARRATCQVLITGYLSTSSAPRNLIALTSVIGLGLDDRRNETIGRVVQHDKPAVGERDRAEETGFRIGDCVDRAGGDLIAKDVRDARVIAASVQIAPVVGEDETLRNRLPEAKLGKRTCVAAQNLLDFPYAEELVTVDFGHRGRQHAPVGRNVEVIRDNAIRKRVHPVPWLYGFGMRTSVARPFSWRTPINAWSTGLTAISPTRAFSKRSPHFSRFHVNRHEVPNELKPCCRS